MHLSLPHCLWVTILWLGISSPTVAVPPAPPTDEVPSLDLALTIFNALCAGSSMAGEYPLVEIKSIPELVNILLTATPDSLLPMSFPKHFVVQHRNYIDHLFTEFNLVDGELGRMFLNMDSSNKRLITSPIVLAKIDDGTALIMLGISSPKIFNTLQTTAKQRATQIIESIVLPHIGVFESKEFPDTISHVGMTVAFSSKDFSDDSIVLNQMIETVTFIAPKIACSSFVSGKLEQEKFLIQSTILLMDRNMPGGVKRISVTIEPEFES